MEGNLTLGAADVGGVESVDMVRSDSEENRWKDFVPTGGGV